MPINDVRVQIVLPPGVTANDVKTTAELLQWHLNRGWAIGGLLGKIQSYKPNEQFMVGVSFPARYMPNYNPQQLQAVAVLKHWQLSLELMRCYLPLSFSS